MVSVIASSGGPHCAGIETQAFDHSRHPCQIDELRRSMQHQQEADENAQQRLSDFVK